MFFFVWSFILRINMDQIYDVDNKDTDNFLLNSNADLMVVRTRNKEVKAVVVEVVNEEYVPITNVTKNKRKCQNKRKYQNNLKENILHVRNNQYTERKTYTDNSLKLIMLNSRT